MSLILVVDDEDGVRKTICDWLNAAGYQVASSPDGESALDLFAQPNFSPDAALVDIKLTGMNGFQLSDRLKKDYAFNNVIFITAFFWEEETRRELAARGRPYFEKPLKFKQQVLPFLERMLQGSK
jgi:CheY-like chemotaxis protein